MSDRVGSRAQANFSAPTFESAHEARAGKSAALSIRSAAGAAMRHLHQRSATELSSQLALREASSEERD